MPASRADIDSFLAHHRIAMVGVSRNPKDFSRMLFHDLCARGYDVVPVNPAAEDIESHKCFPRVQAIQPPVEAALLMTAPQQTDQVVHDCADAGVCDIWMHRGGGQGSVSPTAVEYCHEHGMRVVDGYCPFMFLPKTQFFHRIHGFVLKVMGSYPGVDGSHPA